MNVRFIAPTMRNGRMQGFRLSTETLDQLNALPHEPGEVLYASFTPMRRLVRATYVARTDQGHKVKIDGREQLVSHVFADDAVEVIESAL